MILTFGEQERYLLHCCCSGFQRGNRRPDDLAPAISGFSLAITGQLARRALSEAGLGDTRQYLPDAS